MLTFELFIDDDRYAVPTFKILADLDLAGARRQATGALHESPHHLRVELYGEGRRLFRLGALKPRPAERLA